MKEPSMKHLAFVLLVLLGTTAQAATFTSGLPHSTDNDDSCDIALLPAATLLLPYFEVDLADPRGETTLFTITNASPLEQIAHVTLWTDYGFPVIDFNVYLTGYDVQGLNLYDVIAEGQLAPPRGTGFDDPGSPEGDYSDDNPAIQRETCRNLPMALASVYLTRMQQAFTQGSVAPLGGSPGCSRIGGVHPHATGYATIDVSRRCGILMPTDPAYYTDEIAFDNVLTGDFMQVDGNQNFAQGNPLVHIRAVPEGGRPPRAPPIPPCAATCRAPFTDDSSLPPIRAPMDASRSPPRSWPAGSRAKRARSNRRSRSGAKETPGPTPTARSIARTSTSRSATSSASTKRRTRWPSTSTVRSSASLPSPSTCRRPRGSASPTSGSRGSTTAPWPAGST
jgi:hypothetical protein